MINLLIVDDEETTRESLTEMIPWSQLGVDSVKSARNGLEALELAESFNPSIMLCDVRMPKMDGIELSKRVRQLYPDCEIIFLSGYSDKEYLKTAIQVNAVDYLEKPVDIEELKSTFSGTINKILQAEMKVNEDNRLKSSLNESMHLLRQEMLLELLSSGIDVPDLLTKYGTPDFPLNCDGAFTVVTIKFNWTSQIAVDKKSSLKNTILKLLNEDSMNYEFRFICGFIDDIHLALLTDDAIPGKDAGYTAFFDNLHKILHEYYIENYTFSIACSSPIFKINLLHEGYNSCLDILIQEFYRGVNRLFFPLQTMSSYTLDKNIFADFKKHLRNNHINEAINLVKNLTISISITHDTDIKKIKNIYFNLLRILYEVSMQWDNVIFSEDNDNKYFWQEIDEQLTLQGLSSFLISNIETVYKKSDDKDSSVKKFNDITKYIIDNCFDNQLTIQSIAENTYLSQTYLCAFFKKATGKTINEYITELRIEKAKELLKESKMKLYEITNCVGFTDVNYFSTLFKKHVGSTPSEFRDIENQLNKSSK